MNKYSWRFGIKVAGVFFCAVVFVVLAVGIYYNNLEPYVIDIHMRDFCYNIRGEKYGFIFWLFRIITEFGNLYVIGLLVLLTIVLTKCDYRAILLTLGILLAVLLNVGLKQLYMRERPFEAFRWMEEESTSFPSGHSTAAGFMYTFIIYLVFHTSIKKIWKVIIYIACGILIPLVMLSRMILGVHYLTDVLAGVSVGIMVACLMMQFYKICIKYHFMAEGLIDIIRRERQQ